MLDILDSLKIEILTIFFFLVDMEPNGSENFKTLLTAKHFKLFLNFPANSPHQTALGNFEFLLQ